MYIYGLLICRRYFLHQKQQCSFQMKSESAVNEEMFLYSYYPDHVSKVNEIYSLLYGLFLFFCWIYNLYAKCFCYNWCCQHFICECCQLFGFFPPYLIRSTFEFIIEKWLWQIAELKSPEGPSESWLFVLFCFLSNK